MKLTKTIKEDIVAKVVNGQYTEKMWGSFCILQKEVTEQVKKEKEVEMRILAMAKSYDLYDIIRVDDRVCLMSPKGDTLSCAFYERSKEDAYAILNSLFNYDYVLTSEVFPSVYAHEMMCNEKVLKCFKEYSVIVQQAKKLQESLEGIMASVTTTKQLIDTVPELASYIPEEKNSTALIAIEKISFVRNALGGGK